MASFGKAFSAARKSGKKEFTWKGKSFNTKLAGETPSRGPVPSAAPRASSGSPSRATKPTPTPTPRPSPEGPVRRAGSTMRSPRAVEGPNPTGAYTAPAIKTPQRKSFGGSALGGFIKWGDQVKKRPAYKNPSPRAR